MNPFPFLTYDEVQTMVTDSTLEDDLQAALASLAAAAAPNAPIAAVTTAPVDPFGAVHMTPGDMGVLSLAAPWPHVDLQVDGPGAHFVSFSSSNDGVVSTSMLANFVGSATASGGVLGSGQTTLSISWNDEDNTPQTSTLLVIATGSQWQPTGY